jgi:predicted nucleic acid-binding protein
LAGRRFRQTTAFWDASALVPLCVHETISARAQEHFRRFSQIVWWGSFIEVRSAICRLHRESKLRDGDKDRAVSRLLDLSHGWKEILPSDRLRILAIELLDKCSLKASDSLQLAASLIWCGERPSRRTFICGDQRLAAAARDAGFTLIELR